MKCCRLVIQETKRELHLIQDAIHAKLSERSRLRDAKVFFTSLEGPKVSLPTFPQALLHLLLKISESVTRLESLLLIQLPDHEEDDSIEKNARYLSYSSQQDASDDRYELRLG